jgi:hypothetical protein
VSFLERLDPPRAPLSLRVDEPIQVGRLHAFDGFGEGWAVPDATAIWTQGERAELLLSCDVSRGRHVLTIAVGRVGVRRDDALPVGVVIDGRRVATRFFPGGTHSLAWHVPIPHDAIDPPCFSVVLEIAGRGHWLDGRELGLHLRSFCIRADGVRRRLDDGASALRSGLARRRLWHGCGPAGAAK